MKFNKLGLVASLLPFLHLLAAVLFQILLIQVHYGGQQQQQQTTDANTATKPSDTRAGDSDSQQLYQKL